MRPCAAAVWVLPLCTSLATNFLEWHLGKAAIRYTHVVRAVSHYFVDRVAHFPITGFYILLVTEHRHATMALFDAWRYSTQLLYLLDVLVKAKLIMNTFRPLRAEAARSWRKARCTK